MIVRTSAEAIEELSSSLNKIKRILADVRDQTNYKSPLNRDCNEQHIQESLNNISRTVDEAARKIEQVESRLIAMSKAVSDY